jgi:D-alanine-D-alanine ligase
VSPTRVAVIGGGTSRSLASAASVAEALAAAGHVTEPLTIDRSGCWLDAEDHAIELDGVVQALRSCAVAVPMVPAPSGEYGRLAALCELAGVPYVGSSPRAAALATDTWATKLMAEAVGIRTAGATLVTRGEARHVASLLVADLPMVVRPAAAGSSHGVSLVRTREQLVAALDAAFALDDRVLVEEVVLGREIDVAVLGRPDGTRIVAPALEMLAPASGVVDLTTMDDGSARSLAPAPLSRAQFAQLQEAAVTMYDTLGCAGVARVGFVRTGAGPVLREVSITPGLTRHSRVPRMFADSGISYPELLELLVTDALHHAPGRALLTV